MTKEELNMSLPYPKELQVLLDRLGEENYLGSFTGRETQRPYYMVLTRLNMLGFNISCYYNEHNKLQLGGAYETERTNGTGRDPRLFLKLPPVAEGTPVYLDLLETFNKREGIATQLLKEMLRQLEQRGGLHVVAFKPDGLKFLSSKFRDAGYTPADVLKSPPKSLIGLEGWRYKLYEVEVLSK